MSELLVSDTSVLIDLERGGILAALFQLPYTVGVPDLLFQRELSTWEDADWHRFGLKVLELDDAGVALAQTYRSRDRRLSAADAFALALAKRGPHILLAGDGAVRAMADVEGVHCHGVLWVLDELSRCGTLNPRQLHEALRAVSAHPRCRLPTVEVRRRLDRYQRQVSHSEIGEKENGN